MAEQRNARTKRVRLYWHDIEALIKHHVRYAVCTYMHFYYEHFIKQFLKVLHSIDSYVIIMCY